MNQQVTKIKILIWDQTLKIVKKNKMKKLVVILVIIIITFIIFRNEISEYKFIIDSNNRFKQEEYASLYTVLDPKAKRFMKTCNNLKLDNSYIKIDSAKLALPDFNIKYRKKFTEKEFFNDTIVFDGGKLISIVEVGINKGYFVGSIKESLVMNDKYRLSEIDLLTTKDIFDQIFNITPKDIVFSKPLSDLIPIVVMLNLKYGLTPKRLTSINHLELSNNMYGYLLTSTHNSSENIFFYLIRSDKDKAYKIVFHNIDANIVNCLINGIEVSE